MFDLNVDISSENFNSCDTHPVAVDIEKPEPSRHPNDSTELSVPGVVSNTSSIIINGPPPPSDDRESHGHTNLQYSWSIIATTKLVDCSRSRYDNSGFEDNSLQQQQQGESVVTRKLFPMDDAEDCSRRAGWEGPVGSCQKGRMVGDSDGWLKLSLSDSKTTCTTNVGVCHYISASMMRPATALQQQKPQQVIRKSRRGPRSRSSQYRGVTFYRRTGRWESHIWDCGKQVYLGGFDTAHAAARAYDRAAIKFRGVDADINFYVADYEEDMNRTKDLSKDEFVRILRRQGTAFPRRTSSLSRYNHTINREGGVTGITWHKFGLQPQPPQQVYFVGTNEGKLAHLSDHGGIITSRDNLNLNLGISSAPVIAKSPQGKDDCPVPRHLIYQHLHALSQCPPAGGGRKNVRFHGLPTILPSHTSTSQQPYHTFLSTVLKM